MNKIIKINERQYQVILESVNKGVIKEDSEDIFRVRVPLSIECPSRIAGRYIDIESPKELNITFKLEVYYKSWGIDDIQIWDIKGPRQLILEYTMEPEEEYNQEGRLNDYEEHEHSVILDWDPDKLKIEKPEDRPYIQTRVDNIEIELDDTLFLKQITVYVS